MDTKNSMRLVCISDTHMCHRGLSLPDGDVLVHAGDATSTGTPDEVDLFLGWFASQPHPHKILIAGNHDWLFQRDGEMVSLLLEKHQGITYLQDSGVEIEGVKFWGSPWQPWFMDWAFNLPRKGARLREVWNQIPIDTDVLVTHGPPFGIRDQVHGGEHLGCEELKIRLAVVKPRIHVFGHIHDGYGVAQAKTTTHINACTCTEEYRALNRPVVVDINQQSVKVHGIGSNLRRQRLEAVQRTLDSPSTGGLVLTEIFLTEGHLIALKEMADLRGMRPEHLLQDYADRGLRGDVVMQFRAENKSGKRLVPFIELETDEGTE